MALARTTIIKIHESRKDVLLSARKQSAVDRNNNSNKRHTIRWLMSQVFCIPKANAETGNEEKKPLTLNDKIKKSLKSCVEIHELVPKINNSFYDTIMGTIISRLLPTFKAAVEFYKEANSVAEYMIKHNGAEQLMRKKLTKLVCKSNRNSGKTDCEKLMHYCCGDFCVEILGKSKCTSFEDPILKETIKKQTEPAQSPIT
ncbi:uncharacterized protein LOC126832840 [Adelges cooleyi]|uniref:uncharacterized protein LOC126832840 n=1 Tax=Adelges cooleyi TaxID=133065 RepID=UPI00217F957F|nr:uncharacterized protein LOC126832840 [Adelges cooleyi]